jgi:hypothetical protein
MLLYLLISQSSTEYKENLKDIPNGKTCVQPTTVLLPSSCRYGIDAHEDVRLAKFN